MMFPWALLTFLVGAVFGWTAAGRGMRRLFAVTALLSGLVVAVVAVWAGVYAGAQPLGFQATTVGIFASLVLLTLIFGLGAWLGLLGAERYVTNRSRIVARNTPDRTR